jgi:hypothetical protein
MSWQVKGRGALAAHTLNKTHMARRTLQRACLADREW